MIHSDSPDPRNEEACRMAAARLQHEHRHWMIMWGCYTRTYVAFPLFHAPRGTILTATVPEEMIAKIRRQERAAGMRIPQPSPAPDQQQQRDWYGRRSLDPTH
jgi:hypothetical protein